MRLWKIRRKKSQLSKHRENHLSFFFLWYFCLVLVISLVKFSLFLDSTPIEDGINISPQVRHMEREPLATYNDRKERPTKMTPQFRVGENVQSLLNAWDRFRWLQYILISFTQSMPRTEEFACLASLFGHFRIFYWSVQYFVICLDS